MNNAIVLICLPKCYVCGHSADNALFKVREMMFGLGDEFTYFECQQCGCLQIVDIPQDLEKYYPAMYYSIAQDPNTKPWVKFVRGRLLHRLLFRFESTVQQLIEWASVLSPKSADALGTYASLLKIPLTLDSKILDVGCGSGQLLFTLKNLGFKNVLGCDPNLLGSIQYENGLEILKENISGIESKWDLVMFHHSFEHIPDQVENIQFASQLLKKRGVCLIAMPNVSSYAWKHYRANWVQLDAPRHLRLHTLKSMNVLAGKANLHLRRVFFNSSAFQFWGSEQYAQNIPLRSRKSYLENPAESIFTSRQIRLFAKKAVELNKSQRGDCAAFYLSKS